MDSYELAAGAATDDFDGGFSFKRSKLSERRFWSTTSVLDMASAYQRSILSPIYQTSDDDDEGSSGSESGGELSDVESDETISIHRGLTPSRSLPDLSASLLSRRATFSEGMRASATFHHDPLERTTPSAPEFQYEPALVRAATISVKVGEVPCSVEAPDYSTSPLEEFHRLAGLALPTWSIGLSPPRAQIASSGKDTNERAKASPEPPRVALSAADPSKTSPTISTSEERPLDGAGNAERPRGSSNASLHRRPSYTVAVEEKREAKSDFKARHHHLFSPWKKAKRPRARIRSELPASSKPHPSPERRGSAPVLTSIPTSSALAVSSLSAIDESLSSDRPCSAPSSPSLHRTSTIGRSALAMRIKSPFQRRRVSATASDAASSPERLNDDVKKKKEKKMALIVAKQSSTVMNRLGVSPAMPRRARGRGSNDQEDDDGEDVSFSAKELKRAVTLLVFLLLL